MYRLSSSSKNPPTLHLSKKQSSTGLSITGNEIRHSPTPSTTSALFDTHGTLGCMTISSAQYICCVVSHTQVCVLDSPIYRITRVKLVNTTTHRQLDPEHGVVKLLESGSFYHSEGFKHDAHWSWLYLFNAGLMQRCKRWDRLRG